jgi:hypothetical protein
LTPTAKPFASRRRLPDPQVVPSGLPLKRAPLFLLLLQEIISYDRSSAAGILDRGRRS